jgi:hypothetical protein
MEVRGSPCLDLWDQDPEESLVHQRVVSLKVKGQLGLPVFRDDPDVTAVFFGGSKLKVACVEAQEDEVGTGRFRARCRSQVYGLANCPCLVPPAGSTSAVIVGSMGCGCGHQREQEETLDGTGQSKRWES